MSPIRINPSYPRAIALTTKVCPATWAGIESRAKEMGVSRAEFVRRAIKASLDIKKSA